MNEFEDPNKIDANVLHDLIEASYQRNNTAQDIGLNHGYQLDHSLSNSEHKVFVDPDNQSSTIVFTGSRKAGDWLITDPAVLLGLGKYTPRYKASEQVVEKVKQKYGDNVNTVGHSLAGYLAENVNAKKKYTVNKATPITDIGKTIDKSQTDIRVEGDIVSPIANFQRHEGKYIKIKADGYNPMENHNYNHLRKINI